MVLLGLCIIRLREQAQAKYKLKERRVSTKPTLKSNGAFGPNPYSL